MENLSKTNARRVTVRGRFNTEQLIGVKDLQAFGDGVSFLYNGNINELIRRLSEVSVSDLSINEPDLEEIFMHYYTDGGKNK